MRAFVLNGHGRLVFPSNFSADLDFSVLETLEQLEAVVKRDFEAKAPTGTEILERVEAGAYGSRSQLLRDLAMSLVWGNRYAMTMYEKRPTRWRDLPRGRDDVFLPLLTPWEHGDRKVAAVEAAWGELSPTWDAEAEDRIFSSLFEIFRHKRHHATELPPIKPTVAEITSDPSNLTFCLPRHDPDHPRNSYQEILDCHEAVPELEPLARLAMVLENQYPWDLAQSQLEEVGKIGDDDFVVAFVPRDREVHEFIRRVRAQQPARPRPAPPEEAKAPVAPLPPDRRARAVRADAAARVAGGRQGRARLHERGHHPQRGLQLVADERRGHRGQDGDPRAALHRAAARAHLPAGGPCGTRGRRAPAGGDRRRDLLLVHDHDPDPVRRDLAVRAARDLPDPRLVRPHRRLRGLPVRPRRRGAAAAGGQAAGARRVRREVLGQDRDGPPVADDLRRRRSRARRRAGRGRRGDRDIEVLQAYAGGPVSQVNSIIWPNPEFDNNLTVYGPEVKALVERYLDQMMGELRELSLLDSIDIVVPHQANKMMVAKSATAAGLDAGDLYFNVETVGNVSAASIPIAISDAVRDGAIDRPMRVFTPAFGAGAVGGYTLIRVDPAIVVGERAEQGERLTAPAGNGAGSLEDVRAAFGG